MADGEFNRKTWDNIKNDIIGYELVKFIKQKNRVKDVINENVIEEDK